MSKFNLLVLVIAMVGCSRPDRSLPTAGPPQSMRVQPPPAGFDDCARGILGVSMPVDEAARLLRCTKIFAVGRMPDKKQVQAFNVLFEEPDATARFRSLAVEGQTAGRLYALAALLLLDSAEGNRAAQELSRQSDTVTVLDSDLVNDDQPTREVVQLVIRRRLGQELRDAGKEWQKGLP
jgi:hypothetical protein